MENGIRILMGIYGVLMLGGGVTAYLKAHSQPSLIAGILSGILIAAAFVVSKQQPRVGFGIGALVALALVVVFIRRIMELRAQIPPGSIGMNIGLCSLSGFVALALLYAAVQSKA